MSHNHPSKGEISSIENIANKASDYLEKYISKLPASRQAAARKSFGVLYRAEDLAKHWKSISAGALLLDALAGDPELPLQVLQFAGLTKDHGIKFLTMLHDGSIWKFGDDLRSIGEPFVDALLGASMGLSLPKHGDEKKYGFDTIKRVAGFTILMQFGSAFLVYGGRLLLSEKFPEVIAESIGKMGEELGLSWMMGTLLESIFEQVIGRPLEEYINRQKHPNRLDMMTLRTLARQHKIDLKTFDDKLNDAGYPHELRKLILELDKNQLGPSDLQQAWLNSALSPDEIKQYLLKAGYSNEDATILFGNYISHAETTAKAQYIAAARSAYRNFIITEDKFRLLLRNVNVIDVVIDLEVQAINLEKSTQDHELSIGNIKLAVQRNYMSKDQARIELQQEGYSTTDIDILFKLWLNDAPPKEKHLAPSMILRFLGMGAIDVVTARNKIMQLGYRREDADMMIQHPSTKTTLYHYDLTPAAIVSGYRHGVLEFTEAQTALGKLDINPEQARIMLASAHNQLLGLPPKHHVPKGLPVADIGKAVNFGIIEPWTAYEMYRTEGYTDDAAYIMMLITTKGVYPQSAPEVEGRIPPPGIAPGGTNEGGGSMFPVPPPTLRIRPFP